ncbi:MAG: type II toxin-antitoxin system VapC family toxin [Rhodospirillales bacterium]|nr:type II toxin-antitoxin system VapC family toxin [Rhodospirillales bacterium]
MRYLLDTCTLLWLEFEQAKVPHPIAQELKRAESELFVSVVSGWEISIKQNLRRFPQYPGDLPALIFESCSLNRIQILPVTWHHATTAGALPLHHRDPFDRVLVAQAKVNDLVLVSPDVAFKPYGVETFWA